MTRNCGLNRCDGLAVPVFTFISSHFILPLTTPLLILLGVMQLLPALGFLTRPMCEIHADRIEMKNMLGMTVKTYTFPSLAAVQVSGNRVTIEGTGTLWNLGGTFAHGEDWARFVTLTQEAAR